jgi:hypothetical protein
MRLHGTRAEKYAMFYALYQGFPKYGLGAGCGPSYTSIRLAYVIDVLKSK